MSNTTNDDQAVPVYIDPCEEVTKPMIRVPTMRELVDNVNLDDGE